MRRLGQFLLLSLVAMACLTSPAPAQETALRKLSTGDDSRGWEAVGRLNIGNRGFCTGALIAPQLVLTAAHCLFDKVSGAEVDPTEIEFLAGWRNGRAAAYRGVRRAMAHPSYTFSADERVDRVAYDLALLELDQPVRLPSIQPFETDMNPRNGDEVGVVSYARDRAEAPSLQEVCHVLTQQSGILVLNCAVDFGSSGAPIFSIRDGVARVVSVVSAKAEVDKKPVALGTALQGPLAELRFAFDNQRPMVRVVKNGASQGSGGAKFVKP